MKKLLLFSGLPGVGKSTVSRMFSESSGAKIVDLDDFKKTDVDPVLVKSQIDSPEIRWSYYKKALEYVFRLFDQGVSIAIMDEVFHLGSLRAQIEALCEEQFVQVLWVEVVCPYDLVEKRLRLNKREGHILSTDEALKMNLLFQEIFEEFPSKSINHLTVRNENVSDVTSQMQNILQRIA